MKFKNILPSNIASYLLIIISIILLDAITSSQPKISDDWYVLWAYQNSGGLINYWMNFYGNWTGRVPIILLSSLIIPNPLVEDAYRHFVIIEIIILTGLAWYIAIGEKVLKFWNCGFAAFLLFGMLLWLALPSRAETVTWLNGNFAYLVPAIFALIFIATSKSFFVDFNVKSSIQFISKLKSPICFLIGFLAGSSQEQSIVACTLYSLINLYQNAQLKNLKSISMNYWILLLGFLVGAIFLIAAPGNYVRLSVMDAPGLFDIAKRMLLYIPSAYFEIGTGELGKPIWLGILILFALFYDNQLDKPDNVREAKMWLCVSVATLLTLIPATNQISPRTTFFSVIFLYIAVATFLFKDKVFQKRAMVSFALLVTSALVLVEATVGLIANMSVASEFDHRWALINANQSKQMTVPFITTVPSNLTYIQTPEQDREFLKALSAHVGFKVEHDTSEGAPLPASLKPLKAIKFQ